MELDDDDIPDVGFEFPSLPNDSEDDGQLDEFEELSSWRRTNSMASSAMSLPIRPNPAFVLLLDTTLLMDPIEEESLECPFPLPPPLEPFALELDAGPELPTVDPRPLPLPPPLLSVPV